jgi:cellulose synthase/poly-beta-1,6-N-acetylglucosamine synthase-like glycosyltransferase
VEILKGLKRVSSETNNKIPEEFISVIIPFRNESENILPSLKSLSEQVYSPNKFEVIFANDSSTDDSYEKIQKAKKSANFRLILVPDISSSNAFKKRAISYAIEQARGEIIVTTDADCMHNPNWLKSLMSEFDAKTGLVSGPVTFIKDKSLFSNIQSLEFAGLIIAGAGLIGIGKPTICSGANLAFRKSAYKKVNGYQDNLHLSSGEDELLMQKIAAETNFKIKFSWNKNNLVLTKSNKNIIDFFQQRKRWASKGFFYKNKSLVARLILIYLFFLSIIVQILLTIFCSQIFLLTLLLSLVIKFTFEYKIVNKGSDFLFEAGLIRYFAISELFQIVYITIAGLLGVFGNFKWKDRRLKR